MNLFFVVTGFFRLPFYKAFNLPESCSLQHQILTAKKVQVCSKAFSLSPRFFFLIFYNSVFFEQGSNTRIRIWRGFLSSVCAFLFPVFLSCRPQLSAFLVSMLCSSPRKTLHQDCLFNLFPKRTLRAVLVPAYFCQPIFLFCLNFFFFSNFKIMVSSTC